MVDNAANPTPEGNAGDPNLIGFWDFLAGGQNNDTGLADGIAQNGAPVGGATFESGQLVLDGVDGRFDVSGPDDPFDLAQGRISVEFTQESYNGFPFQALVSRGIYEEAADQGYFEIHVNNQGQVVVEHFGGGGRDNSIELNTPPGTAGLGETVQVSYVWSPTGGTLTVNNVTDGTTAEVSHTESGLDMDVGTNDSPNFTFGARQITDGQYAKFFDGSIDYVQVDDGGGGNNGGADGIVSGTAAADVIDTSYTGDPDGDRVDAGDAILPGEGPNDDIIRAGDGNDTINGGLGADDIFGQDDADSIIGGNAGDNVDGGSGGVDNDTLDLRGVGPLRVTGQTTDADGNSTSGTIEFLDGTGAVTGTMTYTEIENLLLPDSGPDRDGIVEGTDGDDLIDENYTGDPEGDRVDNGDAIAPGDGPDDDLIEAGDGDDTVRAGDGDDTVIGGDGNDNVSGEDGDDVIDTGRTGTPLPDLGFPSYNGLPAVPADPDPNDDLDTVFGGDGNDTISTGDDADRIDGQGGNDSIDGGIDADTIFGGDGNDIIIGGEGSDSINAGAGDDTVYGGLDPSFPDVLNIRDDGTDGPPDPVTNNGADNINAGSGNDLVFGQDDDDTIAGGAGDDTLDGGIDDDFIRGGSGNDSITGGQGVDTLSGNEDRDTFYGINGGDSIDGGEGFSTGNAADDFDTLDLRGAADATNPGGTLSVAYDADNPENGNVSFFDVDGNLTDTARFENIERVIVPCFTPGTMIATPTGERRIEDLQVGDRVITRDNGIQQIRWVGSRELSGDELNGQADLVPVMIRAGSLGGGLPERDMMVSPNHRVLMASDKTALYFEDREVLVAAKHLVGLKGVERVEVDEVIYIHIMFDQHEVILSDGAWTESFQPGDQTLAGVDRAQRDEIFALFPELKTSDGVRSYQAARRSLKRHEAHLLIH